MAFDFVADSNSSRGTVLKRTLVVNQGEIALRVIRACRDMGIEVVAVFSEADREAPYLKLADQAICIGPASAALSVKDIIICGHSNLPLGKISATIEGNLLGLLNVQPDMARAVRVDRRATV